MGGVCCVVMKCLVYQEVMSMILSNSARKYVILTSKFRTPGEGSGWCNLFVSVQGTSAN